MRVNVTRIRAGVGKSTTAVNLAYTLAQMGARVGIFDADVYGPSLPTMVSPSEKVMGMDPVTRALTPTEYEGVKLVSFGFAGQGSAIMRGPMVSGEMRGCTHQLRDDNCMNVWVHCAYTFPVGEGVGVWQHGTWAPLFLRNMHCLDRMRAAGSFTTTPTASHQSVDQSSPHIATCFTIIRVGRTKAGLNHHHDHLWMGLVQGWCSSC